VGKSPVSKARRIKSCETPSGSIGIKAAGALDRFKPAVASAHPERRILDLSFQSHCNKSNAPSSCGAAGNCPTSAAAIIFGLASHPAVLEAWRDGLSRYGSNVAASRATTGNHWLYETLEKRLAQFFGVESVLLVSCG